MSRKVEEEESISIEAAVALHLEIEAPRSTAKQCMKELLESVRKLTKNPKLTIQNIKDALRRWFEEGWAMLAGGFLQVTRAGRSKVKALAEKALAPTPEPQTT
jgi:hypothetical protein